jgi:hypothetical protein
MPSTILQQPTDPMQTAPTVDAAVTDVTSTPTQPIGVQDQGNIADALIPPRPKLVNIESELTNYLAQPAAIRGTGSDAMNRYMGGVTGVIKSDEERSPLGDTIVKSVDEISNSVDPGGTVQNYLASVADSRIAPYLYSLTAQGTSPEAIDNLKKAAQQVQDYKKLFTPDGGAMPAAFEKTALPLLAQSIATAALQPDGIHGETVFRNYSNILIHNSMTATGTWDSIKDFSFSLVSVPIETSLSEWGTSKRSNILEDVYHVLKGLGEQGYDVISGKETSGSAGYMKLLDGYWKMPVTQRIMAFTAISQYANKIYDNKYTYAALMRPFVDVEGYKEIKIGQALDKTVIGSYFYGKFAKLTSFINEVRNSAKVITILRDSGRLDEAGKLIFEALNSEDAVRAEKMTGATEEELKAAGIAFDLEGRVSQVPGLSAQVVKQVAAAISSKVDLVRNAATAVKNADSFILRNYTDMVAAQNKQAKILGDITKRPDVVAAKIIAADNRGFIVEMVKDPGVYSPVTKKYIEDNIAQITQQIDDAKKGLAADLSELDAYSTWGGHISGTEVDANIRNTAERSGRNTIIALEESLAKEQEKLKMFEHKISNEAFFYSFDEMGQFKETERIGYIEGKLKSPVNTLERLGDQVTDVTMAGMKEAQIRSKLTTALKDARKGVSIKGVGRVDKILLAGDELEKEFTLRELLEGVNTPAHGVVRLETANEVAMYYASRKMAAALHDINDSIKAKDLRFNNYRELVLESEYANGEAVKLYTKNSALSTSIDPSVKRILDASTGKMVDVAEIKDLQERLARGERIARLRSGHRFVDEIANYAIIDPEKLRTPGKNVLRRVKGYIPRFREHINYVVKQNVPRMIDGVKHVKGAQTEEVIGFFATKSDAEQFVNRHPDAAKGTVWVKEDKKWADKYKGDVGDEANFSTFEENNFGGMFNGQRTEREILYGLDGDVAERRSAVASLDAYINHVANRASIYDIKNSLIGRFQNTFGKYLENAGDWTSEINSRYTADSSLVNTIEVERRYIEDLMKYPTAYSVWMKNRIRGFSEFVDGHSIFSSKALSKGVMSLYNKDPVGALKTAAYHQLLGFWNVSSLVTQMFGLTFAATAYPLKFPKLIGQSMAIRASVSLGTHFPELLDRIAGHANVPSKWLRNVTDELRKTNLMESLFASGDLNASIKGAGLFKQEVDRMLDMGQVMTKEGESWTRIYSYLLARDNFVKGKPFGYKLTEAEIHQVVKDSFKYSLNLNRAAQASWQKGVMSIPTQFMQILGKFSENMLSDIPLPFTDGKVTFKGSRQWTGAEKAKILIGHMALFGAAGVPFFDSLLSWIHDKKTAPTPTVENKDKPHTIYDFSGIDPATRARLLSGGVADVMGHMLLGGEPDISGRVSVPFGYQQWMDMYATGDKTLIQALGGAGLGAAGRWYTSAQALNQDLFIPERLARLFASSSLVEGAITNSEIPPIFSTDTGLRVLRDLASIASSTRNLDKAMWYAQLNYIADAKGRNLLGGAISKEDFNATIFAQTLGINSKLINQAHAIDISNKKQEAQVSARVAVITAYLMKIVQTNKGEYIDGSKETFDGAMFAMTEGFSEEYKIKIAQGVIKNLAESKDSLIAQWMREYVRRVAQDTPESTALPPTNMIIPKIQSDSTTQAIPNGK